MRQQFAKIKNHRIFFAATRRIRRSRRKGESEKVHDRIDTWKSMIYHRHHI